MRKYWFSWFFVSFLTFGCAKTEESSSPRTVTIPREFQPFVDKFIAEAKLRGVDINLAKNGLVIRYESITSRDAAGLCSYANPHEITIDQRSWGLATESYREFLMFHELGHCVLDRRHRNDRLPNGEWLSIMRGDPQVAGTTWTTNYTGFRRFYYLNELFNTNTPIPEFATRSFEYGSVNSSQKQIIYSDDFSSDKGRWFVGNDAEQRGTISNGVYEFQRKRDFGFVGTSVVLDTSRSYEFEADIRILSASNWAGLALGGDRDENFTYLFFQPNDSFLFGKNIRLNTALFYALNQASIKRGDFNKLTLRKRNGVFQIFINERFVYFNEPFELEANTLALFTSGAATLQMDNVRVSYLP
jgi:hypothetical protein